MIKILTIREIKIGEGIPKICVPIVGKTHFEIIDEAKEILNHSVDLVEWRGDWFDEVFEFEKVLETLKSLRAIFKDIPLLFSFRTIQEGGQKSIPLDEYASLIKYVINTSMVDLVDVELLTAGDELFVDLIHEAHENGVKIVASNHDFQKTPSVDHMVSILRKMQDLGADIPKLAVMPRSKSDVLELLMATTIMNENYGDRPIITMSMSGTGLISRLAGETFGSAVTFGAVSKTSAPGQISAEDLSTMLKILHKNT
ncbi:type I 3-dehydroquinate dehydratase [Alkalibacter mobilis]|uniref:type I 3-dehydroquinate dehydratase n=1 Tax=Alkalibacter mobilis TaxID=2787712 RepID=UPI0038CBFEC4